MPTSAEMVDRWSRLLSICLPLIFLLFDGTLQQQSLVSRQERSALLHLRSSLGLRARDWPLKSDPCTSWEGIQCTNGRVTGINISRFRRTRWGRQNPQFAVEGLRNLTLLSTFNASSFALPGPIPDWFGLGLVSLRVLDLRSCSITGSIPATFGNFSSLVQLYLSDNVLTGVVPPSLSRMIGLSVLNLSRNSLSGAIPAGLAGLLNLTVLDFSSNSFSGAVPPEFGEFSTLMYLNLSTNNLSSSIPPQLGNVSSLVDLDLGFNLLSGPVPAGLNRLRNLQRLVIGNNRLSGQLPGGLFSPLTQLQSVVLRHNGFTGKLPDDIWSIPSLRFLDVSMNNFTGLLPNASSSNGTSLIVANFSQNLFYGIITSMVTRFSFVDLSGNYLEGMVPEIARGSNVSFTRNCLHNTTDQRSTVECTAFYTERNLTFDNFGESDELQPPPPTNAKRRSHRSTVILATVLGSVGIIALVILSVILFIVCKRKRRVTNQSGVSEGPVPAEGSPSTPGIQLSPSKVGDLFTFQQILEATGEFSDESLVKHGHSVDLFHGLLEGGLPVVIKKVDLNSAIKRKSYVSEMEHFSKISHPRLVPFLGHCLENENQEFLVYKHMPNGDLSTALFKKKTSDDSLQSLDWITRLKIAIGAAEGLSYLHHECNPPLVHRDIQASSILLDDKFEVRLGSLSEVCAQEGDAHQKRFSRLLRYPQSSEQGSSGTGTASCAYDVYCFGKVLLELVTGKLGISSSTDSTTKEWLEKTLPYISIYDKELVTNIIDPSLVIDEDLLEEVWAMAIVARSCLNPKPSRRPLMRYILKALENPLKVVREEYGNSARLRTASSRGSWNASALFGSWRHSSSDIVAVPGGGAAVSRSFKRSGTMGSQGSGQHNGTGYGLSLSPSTRRNSREIFPEPAEGRPEAAS